MYLDLNLCALVLCCVVLLSFSVLPHIFLFGCSFSIFNLSMAWEASCRLTEGLVNLETDS
jgi:hypothetical protein